MADEWYYSERDQQRGPVSLDQLRQMAHTGELSPEHLVWTDTLPEWTAAGDLAELFQQPEFLQPPIGVATLGYQSAPQINYYNPTGAVVVYAGFWWRLLAYIIDEAILWLPNYVIQSGLELALRGGLPMPRGNSSLLPMMTVSGGFVPMVLEWLYFALMESSSWQGTVGKKICGLVVTDLSGGRISFGRATGRYFGKIVSAIILYFGFMMAGWTQRKQALHDMMASTLVVKRKLPQTQCL